MTPEKKRRARYEEITIKFVGSTKFKQELVDKIYEVLTDDDFQVKATRTGVVSHSIHHSHQAMR